MSDSSSKNSHQDTTIHVQIHVLREEWEIFLKIKIILVLYKQCRLTTISSCHGRVWFFLQRSYNQEAEIATNDVTRTSALTCVICVEVVSFANFYPNQSLKSGEHLSWLFTTNVSCTLIWYSSGFKRPDGLTEHRESVHREALGLPPLICKLGGVHLGKPQ